jgi:hypothetical protein
MLRRCAFAIAGASLCLSLSAPATAQSNTPQVQFVQAARGVVFKDGVLTLKEPALMTLFFSDRPERLTGQLRNDLFAKLWNEGSNSFKDNPPNAALSIFDPGGQPVQAILVLSNPRLDGRDILYDARVLEGRVPAQGSESTLFIDGYNAPCNSGANNPAYSNYPCWAATAFSRGRQ